MRRGRRAGEGENRHVQSLPGKRGLPLSISASTQPTDHMSMARVYSLKVSMTSGARYHLRRRLWRVVMRTDECRTLLQRIPS